MSILRLVAIAWLVNLKSLTRSAFFSFTAVIQPIVFATIATYMFRAGHRPGTLLYTSLGAALMGTWSATLFGSGGAIAWQRFQGTLELLVASPRPFLVVMAGQTLATATLGVYSLAGTLLWGRLLFGIPLSLVHPVLFVVAVPVTILALGMLGLVLASTFVLYRNTTAFSNLLEYPVWLASGLLVPVSLLPRWVEPLSWLLAPTWGVRAIRAAALGGDPVAAVATAAALGCVYVVLGALLVRHFERLARERATLALA